ncbi:MAG: hypothetical protein IJZ93_00905 [Clostridia bacterium]|nr:hypothetical protein [Clostridia bacterium]
MNQNIQPTPAKKKTLVVAFSLLVSVFSLLSIISKSIEYFQYPDYFVSISSLIYVIIFYILYATGFAMIGIYFLMNPKGKFIGNKIIASALCVIAAGMSMPFLSVFATTGSGVYMAFNGEFITVNSLFAFPAVLIFGISCFSGKTGGLLKTGRILWLVNGIVFCALNIFMELDYLQYIDTLHVSLVTIALAIVMMLSIIMIAKAVKTEIPAEPPKPKMMPQMQFRQAPPNYQYPLHPMGAPQYRPPYPPQRPQPPKQPNVTVNQNGERVVAPSFSDQPANVYRNEKDEIEHVKEIGERILKVKELYEKGIITEREYLDKRAELMSQL